MDQRCFGSFFFGQWSGRADQTAFGTTYGGPVQLNAEVAGEAKAAGMSHTLSIDQQDVRLYREFAGGGHYGGSLAKREQSWNIGECQGQMGMGTFEKLQAGPSHQHYGGQGGFAAGGECDVGSGDQADVFWEGFGTNQCGPLFLELDGLGDVFGMGVEMGVI